MEEGSNDKLKLPKYILVGIVALQIVAIGLTMFMGRGKSGSGSDDSFPFPVWIAIFIPFIVSRGKKKKPSANFLWILVGLASLILLASVLFLLRSPN